MPKINNSLLNSIGYFLIGKVLRLTEKPIRLGNIADPVEDKEAVNLQTLRSLSAVQDYVIVKGDGNSLDSVQNGDYRITVNSSGDLVVQYRTSDAWDTDNETGLATPS